MLQRPHDFSFSYDGDSPQSNNETSCLILSFRGSELLVSDDGGEVAYASDEQDPTDALTIGHWRGVRIIVHRKDAHVAAKEGTRWAGLRALFGVMPDELVAVASLGNQLLEWDRTHRYCGACATPTNREANERARRCPACGLSAYPRISPAMMCLVTHNEKILLARNVNFPAGRYSALAGFLEAGENIEDAIHREVREEVGLEVKNPRYFASQSWPFPNSLMIAFTAEYAGGELKPNGHEIAEAAWFDAMSLPQLPPRLSIARALIDDTLKRLATQPAQ
jgi:NAD+ diphosphatase